MIGLAHPLSVNGYSKEAETAGGRSQMLSGWGSSTDKLITNNALAQRTKFVAAQFALSVQYQLHTCL
jgi:hypothetical protein